MNYISLIPEGRKRYPFGRVLVTIAALSKVLFCFLARLAFLRRGFVFWRCKEILTSQESNQEAEGKRTKPPIFWV